MSNVLSRRVQLSIAVVGALVAGGLIPSASAVTYETFTDYVPAVAGGPVATAWYGDKVAVIIQGETNPLARNMAAMDRIVHTFDNVITAYDEIVGRTPSHSADLNGHIRFEIPLDIGGGLGGHGTYGIAADDAFFNGLYNRVVANPTASGHAYDQVFFYELARNYWLSDLNPRIDYATSDGPDHWGWWTVGFNNAMSALVTRQPIEGLSDMYYFGNNGAYFSNAMTANVDTYTGSSAYTWANSWDKDRMPWNTNTSLNDLMSGTVIKLYDAYGGIRVVEGMYREIPKLNALAGWPADDAGARDNFYLAASRAVDTDLRSYFTGTLKWSLSSGIRPFTDFTWTGAGSTWNTAANWTSPNSSGTPSAEFDRAFFTGNTNTAVNLNGNRTARAIKFTSTATGAYTLSNSVSGASLTLGDGGNITKEANSTTNNQTISSPITLAGDALFANNNGWVHQANKLVLSGAITGGERIRISGTGLGGVELSGNNTGMNGDIVVESGMLLVSNNNALGNTTGDTTLAGGQLWLGSGINTPENIVVSYNSTQSSLGAATMSGNVKVNRGQTFTITNGGGNALTMSGVLSGEGGITFTSANTTLSGSGNSTLTGTIAVSANSGTAAYNELHLNKSGGALAIAGPVNLTNKGTIVYDADNQIANNSIITLNGSNTVLRMNGHNDTIGGLSGGGSGSGIVQNESGSAGTATLTIGAPAGTNSSFGGVIRNGNGVGTDGTLAISKSDIGRQNLSGVNTYTGVTNVTAGILAISGSGSINSSSAVTVNGGTFLQNSSVALNRSVIVNSGTIGGTGSYSGSVALGSGHIAPGDNGAGTVTFIGGIGLSSGSILDFQLGSSSDRINISTGSLTLDGTLNVTSSGGFGTGTYTLFSGFTSLSNNGLNFGTMPSGYLYSLSYTSNSVLLNVNSALVAAVPEPGSMALLGLAAMPMLRRRRRRA
jgi:autotransporter-associated beta strand protein